MQPITKKYLEAIVERINIATKSPMTSYTKTKEGKYRANIGNFHLDGAYGGYALHRMHTEGGGVEDIFGGHYSKRELANRMHAFLNGLSFKK